MTLRSDFTCTYCGKEFNDFASRANHMLRHMSSPSPQEEPEELKEVGMAHGGGRKPKPTTCPTCGEECPSGSAYIDHRKAEHGRSGKTTKKPVGGAPPGARVLGVWAMDPIDQGYVPPAVGPNGPARVLDEVKLLALLLPKLGELSPAGREYAIAFLKESK